jgi:replicative superfamily II helicase
MVDIPDSLSQLDAERVESLLQKKGFDSINKTQAAFLEAGGMDKENTLLCAETGNGKTFCAETVVQRALDNGKSVAYLVPSVSLTNGKYESINEWLDGEYTLANATWGETAGYQHADVIVATFDSYYEAAIRGVGLGIDTLIFDDFHEIYSDFRGDTIEKCLTIARQNGVEIFANSATVGNPDEIARWLESDLIISPAKRSVPIVERPVMKDDSRKSYGEFIGDLIMDNREVGPFMIFNFSTSNAQTRALRIKDNCRFERPDTDYREKVEAAIDTVLTSTHHDLINCLENGVAFHYAGLEKSIKELVEKGVKNGDIKCISCTTTLAYGFDSPIQSVIVADLARFGQFIGKYEYIQWIGRAGRGGDMDEAYAYPIYTDEEAEEYFEFGTPIEEKSLESIGSHFGPVPDDFPGDEYISNAENADTNLRWLLIELVVSGWNTLDKLIEFVSMTLYGFYQAASMSATPALDTDEVTQKVIQFTKELDEKGFINYRSDNQITPTGLGEAVFEYDHSTRLEATPDALKGVVKMLENYHPISPERLVKEFAMVSYTCDLSESPDTDNPLWELLERHGYERSDSSMTAAVMTWLWCQGINADLIEARAEIDVAHLSTTANNLSKAIRAIGELYAATQYQEPTWVETFAQQLADGVTAKDLHLTSYNGVARGRVMALEDQIQTAWSGLDEDTLPGHAATIEKLAFQQKRVPSTFEENIVRGADHISTTTAPTVVEAVEDWVAGDSGERTQPPIAESGRNFLNFGNSSGTIDMPQTAGESTESGSRDTTRRTSLDDFI